MDGGIGERTASGEGGLHAAKRLGTPPVGGALLLLSVRGLEFVEMMMMMMRSMDIGMVMVMDTN
jgi:hypothetical protein